MTDRPAALPQRVYRQLSPRVTGGFFLVAGAILLVLTIASWGSHPAPVLVSWTVLGMVLCWTVLLRPAVVLSLLGVTFRNVVRDVHLPWNQVDIIQQRWNLKIYTPDDKGYTAWAISSQAHRSRSAAVPGLNVGGMGGMSRLASYNPLAAGGLGSSTPDDGAPSGSGAGKGAGKVSAASVAGTIAAAQSEYAEAVRDGFVEEQTGPVTTQWCWSSIVLLVVAVVAVVAVMAG